MGEDKDYEKDPIKHLSVSDWHALYVDGKLVYSWFNNKLDKQTNIQYLLDSLSRNDVDFSERGVIEEYAGGRIKERLLKDEGWPETIEKLNNIREVGLYG